MLQVALMRVTETRFVSFHLLNYMFLKFHICSSVGSPGFGNGSSLVIVFLEQGFMVELVLRELYALVDFGYLNPRKI